MIYRETNPIDAKGLAHKDGYQDAAAGVQYSVYYQDPEVQEAYKQGYLECCSDFDIVFVEGPN